MKNHKIIINGDILPGSITKTMLTCGTKTCSCHDKKNPKLHGPYYRWSGMVDGVPKNYTLGKIEGEEALKRVNNYKKLINIFEQIKRQAIKNAPWVERHQKNKK